MDNPVVKTAPGVDAFVVADLRTYLRAPTTDDPTLTAIGQAAVAWIEDDVSRGLINRTLTWYRDGFGVSRAAGDDFWYESAPVGDRGSPWLVFPVLPVVSLTTIKYYDPGNVQRTLAGTEYQTDIIRGRLAPSITAACWPQTVAGKFNAVEIEYIAGYGALAANIPARMRQAIFMLAGHWYENREAFAARSIDAAPVGLLELLGEFRPGRL